MCAAVSVGVCGLWAHRTHPSLAWPRVSSCQAAAAAAEAERPCAAAAPLRRSGDTAPRGRADQTCRCHAMAQPRQGYVKAAPWATPHSASPALQNLTDCWRSRSSGTSRQHRPAALQRSRLASSPAPHPGCLAAPAARSGTSAGRPCPGRRGSSASPLPRPAPVPASVPALVSRPAVPSHPSHPLTPRPPAALPPHQPNPTQIEAEDPGLSAEGAHGFWELSIGKEHHADFRLDRLAALLNRWAVRACCVECVERV
jgi:hypothetical protein